MLPTSHKSGAGYVDVFQQTIIIAKVALSPGLQHASSMVFDQMERICLQGSFNSLDSGYLFF